jgi:hypothetical protein
MRTDEDGMRVVVLLAEDDRAGHHGLDRVILERARDQGIAGATVWRGIEGFGSPGHVRTRRLPQLSCGAAPGDGADRLPRADRGVSPRAHGARAAFAHDVWTGAHEPSRTQELMGSSPARRVCAGEVTCPRASTN